MYVTIVPAASRAALRPAFRATTAPPRRGAFARSLAIACALTMSFGCSPSTAARDGTSGGEGVTRVRTELRCTEQLPSAEGRCVERGCTWAASRYCGGAPPPQEVLDAYYADTSRPCACVCAADPDPCLGMP